MSKILKDRGYVIGVEERDDVYVISVGYDDRRSMADYEQYVLDEYEGTVEWKDYAYDSPVDDMLGEFVKCRYRETTKYADVDGELVSIEVTERHG